MGPYLMDRTERLFKLKMARELFERGIGMAEAAKICGFPSEDALRKLVSHHFETLEVYNKHKKDKRRLSYYLPEFEAFDPNRKIRKAPNQSRKWGS